MEQSREKVQAAAKGLVIALVIPPVWSMFVMWRFADSGEFMIAVAMASWMMATFVGLVTGYLLRHVSWLCVFMAVMIGPMACLVADKFASQESHALLFGIAVHLVAVVVIRVGCAGPRPALLLAGSRGRASNQ